MAERPYRPISCGLYDQLEILAMRRQPVQLFPADAPPLSGIITDLRAEQGVEYLWLNGKRRLRLDEIRYIEWPGGDRLIFGGGC